MDRRSIFRFLGLAAAAPLIDKLPAAASEPTVFLRPGYVPYAPDGQLQEIISATLNARTKALAENITANNALLQKLRDGGKIRVLTQEEAAVRYVEEWGEDDYDW